MLKVGVEKLNCGPEDASLFVGGNMILCAYDHHVIEPAIQEYTRLCVPRVLHSAGAVYF